MSDEINRLLADLTKLYSINCSCYESCRCTKCRSIDAIKKLQAENYNLLDLRRWRDFKKEKPPSPGGYIVADISYPNEKNWWSDFWDGKTWQVEGDGIWTHWRPIGPLPGGE